MWPAAAWWTRRSSPPTSVRNASTPPAGGSSAGAVPGGQAGGGLLGRAGAEIEADPVAKILAIDQRARITAVAVTVIASPATLTA